MHTRVTTALLIALPVAVAAQPPVRVGALKISDPSKVAEIDLDKLKGQPSRLSWSDDGSELYLQMFDGEFGMPPKKLTHHSIKVPDGSRRELQSEPEWASGYWTRKSGQTSPDGPPLTIELRDEIRTEKAVSTPMGGDLARGGASVNPGASAGEALNAAYNQQQIRVITTLLKGTPVGVFEGTVLIPGRTFGWGPKGSRAIVFAEPKSGRLYVMDESGSRREVEGSKDAILPAWSPDGSHLAWLQKDGKKKYVLHIARVAQS